MAKVEVSLLEFFRTGKFGPIYLGMDINRLEDIIGNPTDYDSLELWLEGEKLIADPSGIPPAVSWFWVDYIQFGFTDDGKVDDIFTDYLERLKPQGAALTLDLWIFEDDKTPHKDKVIAELAKEKIHFHVYEPELFGLIILKSNVAIAFEYDDSKVSTFGISDGPDWPFPLPKLLPFHREFFN